MNSEKLYCLFCGEPVDNQDVDADLGVYVACCSTHGYQEAEYTVTEENAGVLSKFASYERYWEIDDYASQDGVDTIEQVSCPLCGDATETTVAVYHGETNWWDTYVFECPDHGVMKMKVECETVRAVDDWDDEFAG